MAEAPQNTKRLLFDAALELFSSEGYHNVSMRQIADKVGIRASSIYNHYKSKKDILSDIFESYMRNRMGSMPVLEDLLALVGKEKPKNILYKTIAVYPEGLLPMMSHAMHIANNLESTNKIAGEIIDDIINLAPAYSTPLLKRMIEMGEIEPMDVERFGVLFSALTYSSAMRYHLDRRVTTEDYVASIKLLFDLVVEKE